MGEKWLENYEQSKALTGFVDLKDATSADYERLGFRCGLEVHQQLLTDKKLFCRCPAGVYHDFKDYDAEIIRHMRPTLSELGEYDGTALMEFKTKKEIVYLINKKTACTYEMDDTPPFPINREALERGLKIAHLLNMKIVGELHITRKQYLDGSIPTGFQRTTILGIEGEIYLKNKPIRLIQFSVEEDSCREVSDIAHRRVYFTDRLGMPLIETVTYPEMLTPWEAAEACQNIRFIARSTGLVRTGIGAGREDVNVSVTGGTRVEIKGVAHIKWIPALTHNEGFRQKALLLIKDELNKRVADAGGWKIAHKEIKDLGIRDKGLKTIAVNLPNMKGILSFFTQPHRTFADEIADRLKVIACLEKPNMIYSEFVPFSDFSKHKQGKRYTTQLIPKYPDVISIGASAQLKELYAQIDWADIQKQLNAGKNDAQIIFWSNDDDLAMALDTIEERIKLAFAGVPNETRKSFPDGTSIFERVLPGADRMYPDTDSKPVSLSAEFIEQTRQNLPESLSNRFKQFKEWGVPEDSYIFILRNNLTPLIEKIAGDFGFKPHTIAVLFAQYTKSLCGKYDYRQQGAIIKNLYPKIYDLCAFIKGKQLDFSIVYPLLKKMFNNPELSFDNLLSEIDFTRFTQEEIFKKATELAAEYDKLARKSESVEAKHRWIMGKLKPQAVGNVAMTVLAEYVEKEIL